PPLALLPLIFIALGTEEEAKITLIVLGIFPTLTQDVCLRVREIPMELIQKAFTLGASAIEVTFKVILASIWPRVLDSIRLSIGPAWIFLIAAEAISSEAGLGYRIYVVQRQLGVNMILPYIAWISLLGYGMDYGIRLWIRWRHPWSVRNR
ncbi:MAG: ABC transporter permease subunit, partial [Deltaproteobacteria bacterium]